jgi:hypothetical protein
VSRPGTSRHWAPVRAAGVAQQRARPPPRHLAIHDPRNCSCWPPRDVLYTQYLYAGRDILLAFWDPQACKSVPFLGVRIARAGPPGSGDPATVDPRALRFVTALARSLLFPAFVTAGGTGCR